MISVILPSRGRPASLLRAVSSLAQDDCEIIVGLDSDDPTIEEAERLIGSVRQVRIVKSTRKPTVGALFNYLGEWASGDWLIPFPDDYVVDQSDWATRTQKTLDRLPNGMGLAYLWDPVYPHFATFPLISKAAIEMQGFFMPPFFPFLFGDTWWNEVGVMSGMILPASASVTILKETGNIHNYRNLKLWATLFEKTRPLRQQIATQMIRNAMGEEPQAAFLINSMSERIEALEEMQAPFMTDEFCTKWNAAGDGFPHPHYDALEAKTLAFMEQM